MAKGPVLSCAIARSTSTITISPGMETDFDSSFASMFFMLISFSAIVSELSLRIVSIRVILELMSFLGWAESFARIFYRNAFAIGLTALEIPEIKGKIRPQDELEVDVSKFSIKNIKTGENFQAKRVPEFMQHMLLEGGLVEYYLKYMQFPWSSK